MKQVIAIDMGATNIRVGVVNQDLEIVEVVRERTSHQGNEALIDQIITLINSVHFQSYDIESITIGVPGRVRNDGYVYELPNIGVKDLDLVHPLENHFHTPVHVINDAVAAGLAEAVGGNGRHSQKVFFVTISSGIGGSFFIDKRYAPSSSEIGHTLFEYHGQYYELEKIASGYGLCRLAKLNDLEIDEGYKVFQGYLNHDERLSHVYNDWLALMHDFLGFIQNTFTPDIIVFSGGVMKSSQIFFEDLKNQNPNCRLIAAHYDQDAGLIGAACYGIQN